MSILLLQPPVIDTIANLGSRRTWRTEGSPEWDAQRLLDAGIFPQPLTDRKFGQICSNV